MAITPYQMDADGPPCALKIGPVNCFCVWESNPGEFDKSNLNIGPGGNDRHQLLDANGGDGPPAEADFSDKLESGFQSLSGMGGATASQSSRDPPMRHASDFADRVASVWRAGFPGGHPLLVAARLHCGTEPAVLRQLQLIESTEAYPSPDALERLRRLIVQYRSSARALSWPTWDEREGLRLAYGGDVCNGLYHWFRQADFLGCDVVKALAALLEVDLSGVFNPEVLSAEPLGVHTAKRDAIWCVTSTASHSYSSSPQLGKRSDAAWMYAATDALDEPIGSLVVFAHSPPDNRRQSAQSAMALHRLGRIDFECLLHCIEPLWPPLPAEGAEAAAAEIAAAGPLGFRLTQLAVLQPAAPAPGQAPLPPALVANDLQEHERFLESFSQVCSVGDARSGDARFIAQARRLEERMRMSPRTELYERVRRHLPRTAPRPKKPPAPCITPV
eukprot:TRINITY_DN80666_c0_g1_i1.p1 TRINITY_DN80666_c0_g1~~TRINITY_DN80666_c0_g1_i1.p1  ORF type:complete len:446 (+),score=87.25 TRINITY_DN80666_c0_g1_i1:128-1465(+)